MPRVEKIIKSNMPMKQKYRKLMKLDSQLTSTQREREMADKLSITTGFMEELSINKEMKEEVIHIIKHEFPNLRMLSKSYPSEKIILIIIYYVILTRDSRARPNWYSLFKKYNITPQSIVLVFYRMIKYYRENSYIK